MTTLEICDYKITEKLSETAATVIYRATGKDDGESVILTLPKSAQPSSSELDKLRREYEINALFNHNKIIQALALHEFEHKLVLVKEDCRPPSLSDR